MDIAGPCVMGKKSSIPFQPATSFMPAVNDVHERLVAAAPGISGSSVEHNKFCVSMHYRNCDPDSYQQVWRCYLGGCPCQLPCPCYCSPKAASWQRCNAVLALFPTPLPRANSQPLTHPAAPPPPSPFNRWRT